MGTIKTYTAEWGIEKAKKDFGAFAFDYVPIEKGTKSFKVDFISCGEKETIYVSGVKDMLSARYVTIVATCGTCRQLSYTEI